MGLVVITRFDPSGSLGEERGSFGGVSPAVEDGGLFGLTAALPSVEAFCFFGAFSGFD
ncbi:MAG: hypothetical protein HC767_00380 [Akkermansiaceae bacterium]|nr:hypothetical protein [Akkermansiaceae bacterium]